MSKRKSKFTSIEIDGRTYLIDGRGALHLDDGEGNSAGQIATAKEIEQIAAYSAHQRNAPTLPDTTATGYDVTDYDDQGGVQVGCTGVAPEDVTRVLKASRRARGRK